MTDSCVIQQISWKSVAPQTGAILIVGLVVLFLELFGEPTKRGFFCNDDTIKYPFNGNTISESALVVGAIIFPLLVICPTQFWTYGQCVRSVQLWKCVIPKWLRTSLVLYGSYLIGLGLGQIITNVGKFTIGRLRPHFLAVCLPDIPCNGGQTGYITQYNCTGLKNEVLEARLSFPSGHATVAFYTCIYLTMHLELSMKWKRYGVVQRSIQFIFITMAWWISLTRVMDNWHHWSDVMAGVLLGCISAIITVKTLPGMQPVSSTNTEDSFLPLKRSQSTPHVSSEPS